MIQRHEVSKGFWKNGTDRLVQYRVATNLQFIKERKKLQSVECKVQ